MSPLPKLAEHIVELPIRRNLRPLQIEQMLTDWYGQITAEEPTHCAAKLATHASRHLTAELWTAIAVGTICSMARCHTTVSTWGSKGWQADLQQNPFATSLAGLVALQLADSVVTDGDSNPVDFFPIERTISRKYGGLLEQSRGPTRTIVEFDPQQPIAALLQDRLATEEPLVVRRLLLRQLLLRFRTELDVTAARAGIPPSETEYHSKIATLIVELFDNAYEHGRPGSSPNRQKRGVRFLRIRKHIAPGKEAILDRAEAGSPLRQYLEETLGGRGPQAFLETNISDFGEGIVDHFLKSPAGYSYREIERNQLLKRLALEPLTSRSLDPAAGDGIDKALKAAKSIGAFVSLRTAEFWFARSYASAEARDPTDASTLWLQEVPGHPHPHVAGTHWLVIWPLQ